MEVSLPEMIQCVDRELMFRRNCYPRWVTQHKLTQRLADLEIARMQAIRDFLARVAAEVRA